MAVIPSTGVLCLPPPASGKVQFFLLFSENLLTTGHKYDTNFLYILLLLLKLTLFTCFGMTYPFADFFQLVEDMGFPQKQQT